MQKEEKVLTEDLHLFKVSLSFQLRFSFFGASLRDAFLSYPRILTYNHAEYNAI